MHPGGHQERRSLQKLHRAVGGQRIRIPSPGACNAGTGPRKEQFPADGTGMRILSASTPVLQKNFPDLIDMHLHVELPQPFDQTLQ